MPVSPPGLGLALGGTTPEGSEQPAHAPRGKRCSSRPIRAAPRRPDLEHDGARSRADARPNRGGAGGVRRWAARGNPLAPAQRAGERARRRSERSTSATTTEDTTLDTALGQIAGQIDPALGDAALCRSAATARSRRGCPGGLAVDVPASRERVETALASGVEVVDLVVAASCRPRPRSGATARDQLERLAAPDQPFTYANGETSGSSVAMTCAVPVNAGPTLGDGQPRSRSPSADPAWAADCQGRRSARPGARFAFNGGDLKVLRPSQRAHPGPGGHGRGRPGNALLSGEHPFALTVSVDPRCPRTIRSRSASPS